LVIGGGISGIQAALDIANAGFEVVLVEKEPSIGGHMSQLSETFPTLDWLPVYSYSTNGRSVSAS